MPNSCSNVLSITGPPKVLERFQSASKSGDAVLSFDSLCPLPDQGLSNEEKHSWILQNWGTWLVYPALLVTSPVKPLKRLVYEFVTAWSPPIALFEHVAPEYPELKFELRFCEPTRNICGHVTVHYVSFKGESDLECTHSISDYSRFRILSARFGATVERL